MKEISLFEINQVAGATGEENTTQDIPSVTVTQDIPNISYFRSTINYINSINLTPAQELVAGLSGIAVGAYARGLKGFTLGAITMAISNVAFHYYNRTQD